MNLLKVSISAPFMILGLLLIRITGRKYISKTGITILWNLILLRLLLPFQLSIDNIPILGELYNKAIFTDQSKILGKSLNLDLFGEAAIDAVQGNDSLNRAGQPRDYLWLIWMAGAFLMLTYFLKIYLKERKKLRKSIPAQNETAERLIHNISRHRKIRLYTSKSFPAPVTYGIFFPKIILPVNLDTVSRVDLRNMVEHELVHIRRLDVAKRYLMAAALCIHWFNPLIWLMYYLYQEDQEISCDEQVLKHMENEEAKSYIYTMIKMASKGSSLLAINGFAAKNSGKKRILAAMNRKKIGIGSRAIVGILGISLSLSFFSFAQVKNVQGTDNPVIDTEEFEQGLDTEVQEPVLLSPFFEEVMYLSKYIDIDEDFDYEGVMKDIVENYNNFSQPFTKEQEQALIIQNFIYMANEMKAKQDKGMKLEPSEYWLIDEFYQYEERHQK